MDRFRLKNARVIIPRLETLEVFVNSKARRDESDNNTDTDESEENEEDVFWIGQEGINGANANFVGF